MQLLKTNLEFVTSFSNHIKNDPKIFINLNYSQHFIIEIALIIGTELAHFSFCWFWFT